MYRFVVRNVSLESPIEADDKSVPGTALHPWVCPELGSFKPAVFGWSAVVNAMMTSRCTWISETSSIFVKLRRVFSTEARQHTTPCLLMISFMFVHWVCDPEFDMFEPIRDGSHLDSTGTTPLTECWIWPSDCFKCTLRKVADFC